jgi:hypothetical protein
MFVLDCARSRLSALNCARSRLFAPVRAECNAVAVIQAG